MGVALTLLALPTLREEVAAWGPWLAWLGSRLYWLPVLLGIGIVALASYSELKHLWLANHTKTTDMDVLLGHRLREDFRAGVKPADDGVTLVLQKHSLDDYVGIECVVLRGRTGGQWSDPILATPAVGGAQP